MPPGRYSVAELAGIVAYVRNIRARAADVHPPVGDLRIGQDIFEGKGGCLHCHRVVGKGSRVAPDLTNVGNRLTAGSLERSLLEPSAMMSPMNRSVRAVTKGGTIITGRRLNEDTFTVQLIDDHETLISLLKSDLSQYEILEKSPMPSYKEVFTPGELSDVLAYLLSLKETLK
jgi:putative heme-binding domain-containing protein